MRPGPFPPPEAHATQGSYEDAQPMVQDALRRIVVGIIPIHHGPNKSSGPVPRTSPVPDAAIPAVTSPMQPPRKTGIGAGGITAIVAAVIGIPALLFIAVTARLMTVAKNHISQGANEPTNSYGNASPSDPNQADPEPTSTVYRMDERPGFRRAWWPTSTRPKLDHYKDEILNNNTMFMSEYRIPDTQNGADYVTDTWRRCWAP